VSRIPPEVAATRQALARLVVLATDWVAEQIFRQGHTMRRRRFWSACDRAGRMIGLDRLKRWAWSRCGGAESRGTRK
jgi:hypothetical protein